LIDRLLYAAGDAAANPQAGGTAVSRGFALLLSLVLLGAGACGAAPPPASRSDVERGTALPPPGLNAVSANGTTTPRR
jgi:hypothetical protein